MKKSIFVIMLLASSIFAHAQKANKQTIVIKTQISCNHCLQCGSCGANIREHITVNKGIKKVAINPRKNTITVTFDANKVTPEIIKDSILKAGYDADEQKAPAHAVNALDGCCKNKSNN
ncbi:MAG: heavy-metal-associated domain-containing protein [Saprospiraceae bacterium]|nr:heavy-metal-associated domain-containing protein [Candidatus Vicinibacter proximus]MBL7823539.1 heavy-metal-associated domain-containing protein [Saprospiraceae bacterium]MCC6842707.1 heavy-metal-associated domain-containing protein [Saprospiraceae bacterium]